MNAEGKVFPKKYDKFRQLNRFLEILDDVISSFRKEKKQKLNIVDFGCGKAYLTFALYYYLTEYLEMEVNVVGIDLKKEVVEECQQLAERLDYDDLKFVVGNIEDFQPAFEVDLMIALHACNTATDAALEKAVRWGTEVILAVPCCQHELFGQIHSEALVPLLHHGILKERFAALATDAARAQILEVLGYQTQVMEFIDLEHTPKNILIRATKKRALGDVKKALAEYQEFKQLLNITPSLERRFMAELKKIS